MEDTKLVETAPANSLTAALDGAGQVDISQLDLEKLNPDQLGQLLSGEGGEMEIPLKSSGEGEAGAQPAAPTAEAPKDEPTGETPSEVVEEEVVEEPVGEVTDTVESSEEIKVAAQAARQAVLDAGGTEEEAAAAEASAREPVAAVDEPIVEDEEPTVQRPRLKDTRDQLIAGIYLEAKRNGAPISWAEAETRVDGPKAEETAPVATTVTDYAGIVTTLEGEVQALQATVDGFEEGLFTPAIAKTMSELQDKKAELKLAKRDQEAAERQASEEARAADAVSKENRTKARADAIKDYPDAASETSALGKAVRQRIQEMKNPKHPDHAILFADSAPFVITQKVAREMGIAPATVKKAVTPPVKQKVVTPPRKVVSPAPGGSSPSTQVQPASAAKQLEEVKSSDDLALLDAVQGGGDMTRLLAGAVR